MKVLEYSQSIEVHAGYDECTTATNAAIGAVATAAVGCAAAPSTALGVAACAVATANAVAAVDNAQSVCPAAPPTASVCSQQEDGVIGFSSQDVGSCDGGGGGGKVICTELCRNGIIEHDVWMADLRYSRQNFSAQTMRGYHLWGIPYVKLMRKYPSFGKVAAYPTRWFAADIAYRMGVRSKPNYAGWALRELAFRPICWTIGIVAKARNWQGLWAAPNAGLPSA